MQHFRVNLECGHHYEVSAMDSTEPANYVGQTMPRCITSGCPGPHAVISQEKIARPGVAPAPKAKVAAEV